MDIFGKEAIVEIPAQITPEQKAWLDMMVRKGKIAVPPGGTLPEGSVISIFMRTLLWNSEEQGQTLDMVTREGLEELRSQRNLVERGDSVCRLGVLQAVVFSAPAPLAVCSVSN